MSRVIARPTQAEHTRGRRTRNGWRPLEAMGLIGAGLLLLVIGTALSVADAIQGPGYEGPGYAAHFGGE
ncbi:conserved hypothetical protein [Methylobacterium nodulans ORS 2060]|uniref:Uncharacterized protein n=1 Tax=Methylobacterium nodulans (strain LMG 21967 / CNCM I-2342 / ORS 2060) TaxID=460265 RepID=B8IAH4_METNO|nr:conserved hypothetical protein [Methylobacterium nodulans ORS 2060]